MTFYWRGLLLAAALLPVAACDGRPAASAPPVTPVLHSVLLSGSPPTFAKQSSAGLAFEVLPAASVLLRMTSAFPEQVSATRIVIRPRGGQESAPLTYVQRDDVTAKQSLASTGYFEAVQDAFAYTVIVTPPLAERTGAGFDLELRNMASNPPTGVDAASAPLVVSVMPKSTEVRPSAVGFDCGLDINFRYHNCKVGSAVVVQDFTLEGWLVHTRANRFRTMPEDQHYYFVPNVDFIEAIYGERGTLATVSGVVPFSGLRTRGNPAQPPSHQLLLHDIDPASGTSRGFTVNSLVLPFNIHFRADESEQEPDDLTITKTELNAWYVSDNTADGSTYVSRGPAPVGWRAVPFPSGVVGTGWDKTRWPFDPFNPDGGPAPLAVGEYVRVNGALYVDSSHDGTNVTSLWEAAMPGHGGWMEIHPVDWLRRVPAPALRKTPVMAELIGPVGTTKTLRFSPEVARNSGQTLRCRELVDGRFTNADVSKSVVVSDSSVAVTLTVTQPGGRFKASYIVWWESSPTTETTCR
jgi:hypothetical protein